MMERPKDGSKEEVWKGRQYGRGGRKGHRGEERRRKGTENRGFAAAISLVE
jgi:hypothetical protein